MIGLGSDFWGNALFILPSTQYMLESEWLEASVKMIPLFFSFSGVSLAVYHYLFSFNFLFNLKKYDLSRKLYTFLNRKWFFDKVYNDWISQGVLSVSYNQTYKNVDRGLLEFLGPQGISYEIYKISKTATTFSIGFIFHYLFILLFSLFFILFFFGGWSFISTVFDISLLINIFLIFIYLILYNSNKGQ
jgi:NADH-ubiquinone oxidoreductase chain 5